MTVKVSKKVGGNTKKENQDTFQKDVPEITQQDVSENISSEVKAPTSSAKTSLYKKDSLKIPPHNIEAEESVIGSLMLDKDAIVKVADILHPEDFYDENNGAIYGAAIQLYSDQSPMDIINVSAKLKEQKILKRIGGRGRLTELINSVPTASNVDSYAKIVS
jgi:hypothetical protein